MNSLTLGVAYAKRIFPTLIKRHIDTWMRGVLTMKNKTCYPTATLSDDNKILYFTKRDRQGYAQLFERNLSTNEEKQLTSKIVLPWYC